jgi:hypothetical protein
MEAKKETDIEQRSLDIQNGFLDFLMRNNLLK